MVHRGKASAVRAIKQFVQARAYEYTDHAYIEMREEAITDADVNRAVVEGHLVARRTKDKRGTRYVFRGVGFDDRTIGVVCRILVGKALIVTAYRI